VASLKGQLLLASSKLIDPNFARAVVLMVQHDDNGAMGLILNRPLETTIQEVCSQQLNLVCAVEGPLHLGGPCEGPLMILHTRQIDAQVEVIPDVYFTTDKAQIESLLLDVETTAKCFVGYAGWSPGQLESEMESGSWLNLAATKDQVFPDSGGPKLWQKLMQKVTLGQWIDPDRIPQDPNMN
jgi:putative transcriptional regulator